ncbi:Putative transcriptional regulator [Mycobacteroides abscessus subsp. abscessus]|uniref:Transcriptional regulator n=2 Tax=Mycobacteroides abscessus TaxID=36809 RepID=A0AB33T915_9MYCO|nr:redox-sensitive transcriptional activator SoxR [Mycobacteroides abscessus]EIC66860.1 putative transcriptional regulator [Mycobacteroides abscessus M94]EIC69232.1 putative transcriptional regulator [Mycobacteroides abscessus M93]EIT93830.1 redox-sensitive transcriptional activator SoxR [Mycobacteroides abscessus 4S-0726-RA]EIT97826.1 redox-sensitive transcriptional activator SoxR [Mycobacteroides abscessus 4S-0726-RB]EIU02786.1 redox-sensitive transcriptional activator SoxR [Mycobacteroides 
MKGKTELLPIGEVARRSGIAVSAVRYYADIGLVPAERTSGNVRVFRRHALRRISLIRVATGFGIPLSEVAEVLSTLPDYRAPSTRDWQRISRRWHAHLEARKNAITDMQEKLTGCIGCGCLSMTKCALFNPADILADDGSTGALLLADLG